MREKIKAFFIGVGAAMLAIISFMVGKKLYNHGNSVEDLEGRINDCKDRASGISEGINKTAERLERADQAINRASEILDSIEKTGQAR